jgi:hypothetical protein
MKSSKKDSDKGKDKEKKNKTRFLSPSFRKGVVKEKKEEEDDGEFKINLINADIEDDNEEAEESKGSSPKKQKDSKHSPKKDKDKEHHHHHHKITEDMKVNALPEGRVKKVSSYSFFNYRCYRDNTLRNKILHLILPVIKKPSFWLLRPDKVKEHLDNEYQRYNHIRTKYVGLLSFRFDNRVHDIEREDMDHLIESDFEFLKVPNIANFDKALHWKFGDYMTPKQIPNYHQDVFYDADHCYKDYLNGKLKY